MTKEEIDNAAKAYLNDDNSHESNTTPLRTLQE